MLDIGCLMKSFMQKALSVVKLLEVMIALVKKFQNFCILQELIQQDLFVREKTS